MRTETVWIHALAPAGATTCTKLTSRNGYDKVTLICTSNLFTLQHNGANPDGFFLQGGANFTFGANPSKITLQKLNGGYWTEMSRDLLRKCCSTRRVL